MADEARVQFSMSIAKGNLEYTKSGNFQADVATGKGPTPGAIAVSTSGVTVDLSELSTPALCVFKNLDATNFVEVGLYISTTFYPLFELLPGESYPLRLSRNVGTLRARANTAAINLVVEAFEA